MKPFRQCGLQTLFCILILLRVGFGVSAAKADADCVSPTPIRFKQGASNAKVTGTVLRAEYACYTLSARAGQPLDIDVASPDQNVVLIAYKPGYRIKQESDGPDVSGATLPTAGEQDEATTLKTNLPTTGTYLLLLGTTRGAGGTYTLDVAIGSHNGAR